MNAGICLYSVHICTNVCMYVRTHVCVHQCSLYKLRACARARHLKIARTAFSSQRTKFGELSNFIPCCPLFQLTTYLAFDVQKTTTTRPVLRNVCLCWSL